MFDEFQITIELKRFFENTTTGSPEIKINHVINQIYLTIT